MEKIKWIDAQECLPPCHGLPYITYVIWVKVTAELKPKERCSDNKECEYGVLELLIIIDDLYDDDDGSIIERGMVNHGTMINFSHINCRDEVGYTPEECYDSFGIPEGEYLTWRISNIVRWVALPSIEINEDEDCED